MRQISWLVNLVNQKNMLIESNTYLVSWNYDSLMEVGYLKIVEYNFDKLDLLMKKYLKVNGTVHFIDYLKTIRPEDLSSLIINFENKSHIKTLCLDQEFIKYVRDVFIKNPKIKYVWDRRKENGESDLGYVDTFIDNFRLSCAEEGNNLVVCGYSFPFVNRLVDQKIIKEPLEFFAMNKAKKKEIFNIYIQDPFYKNIKEKLGSSPAKTGMAALINKAVQENSIGKEDINKIFIPPNIFE